MTECSGVTALARVKRRSHPASSDESAPLSLPFSRRPCLAWRAFHRVADILFQNADEVRDGGESVPARLAGKLSYSAAPGNIKPRVSEELPLLCEEIVPIAFHGSAQSQQ